MWKVPNLRTRRAFIEVRLNQSHIFIDVGLKLSYIKDIAIQQGFAGSAVGLYKTVEVEQKADPRGFISWRRPRGSGVYSLSTVDL